MVRVIDNESGADFLVHKNANSAALIMGLTILCMAQENLTIGRVSTFPDGSNDETRIYDVHTNDWYVHPDVIWYKYGITVLERIEHKNAVFNMIWDELRDIPLKDEVVNWLLYKTQKFLNTYSDEAASNNSDILGPLIGSIDFLAKKLDEKIDSLNAFVEINTVIEKALKTHVTSILVLEIEEKYANDYLKVISLSSNAHLRGVKFLITYCHPVSVRVTIHSIVSPGTFGMPRGTFPRKWCGKTEKQLKKLTKVSGFTTCSGGLGICTSLDAAIAVAKIAVDKRK